MKTSGRRLPNRTNPMLEKSIQQIEAAVLDPATHAAEFGDISEILLDAVRPDPAQPRSASLQGLTLDLLRRPEAAQDADQRATIDKILGLAQSIAHSGQKIPIEVYRDGSLYRIIAGERRWWACQHLGLRTIMAKILSSRPQDLKVRQYIENAQREDFTIVERLIAIRDIQAEMTQAGQPLREPADLMRVMGMTRTTAYDYWGFLQREADILPLYRSGRLQTLTSLRRLISASEINDTIVERLTAREETARKQEQARGRSGVPRHLRDRRRRIELGTTASPITAQAIYQFLTGLQGEHVDWGDAEQAARAVQSALRHHEQTKSGGTKTPG